MPAVQGREMSRRKGVALGVVALCLCAASILAWHIVARDSPLDVIVQNDTGTAIDGLELQVGKGLRTPMPIVRAGGSASVRPQLGGGESSLHLWDAAGNHYVLKAYFEGHPTGAIRVYIEAAAGGVLRGRVIDATSYGPEGESPLALGTR